MLRFGIISEIDVNNCYARVKFLDDDTVSDFLQIVVMGALSNKFFHIFDVNEQVACLMDENSEEGVILGAVFNNKTHPDGGDKDIVRVLFSDNSSIEYNRNSHEYNIDIKGKINIKSDNEVNIETQTAKITAENVTIEGNTDITGDVTVTGAVDITGATSVTGNVTVTGNIISTGSITAASISAPIIGGGGISMSSGNLTATGDITAGTVSLKHHIHAGVTVGSGSTAQPTP